MAEVKKANLKSMNIPGDKLRYLKQVFPEAFTEGLKVDIDKLRLALGESVDAGKERLLSCFSRSTSVARCSAKKSRASAWNAWKLDTPSSTRLKRRSVVATTVLTAPVSSIRAWHPSLQSLFWPILSIPHPLQSTTPASRLLESCRLRLLLLLLPLLALIPLHVLMRRLRLLRLGCVCHVAPTDA